MSLRPLITWYKRRALAAKTDFMPRCIALNNVSKGYDELTVPINKNYDLLQILERLQPRSILECGSGTTTLMFDYYSRQTGARVETHEHDARWHAAVVPNIVSTDLKYHLDELRIFDGSTEYDTEFKDQYDFMYIDAPPMMEREFNSDFLHVIKQPSLRAIALDIRDSTALKIFDYLVEHDIKAKVSLHKNFHPNRISDQVKSHLTVRHWMDKRHTLIEIQRT